MNEFFQVALEVITPILITAGLGFWFGRQFKPDPHTLSRIALYVFMPPLVFQGIAHSDMQASTIGQIMLLVILVYFAMTLIARLLLIPQRGLPPATQSAFVLSAMMANSGNYGLPFVEFAFGQAGLQFAIIVFVTASLINHTLGIYVASWGTASLRQGILNVLRVPLPYAAVLGIVVNLGGYQIPLPLDRALSLMGQAAMPLMLVLLGVQLARISLQSHIRQLIGPLSLSAATRLLIAPPICLLLAAILGVSGLPRDVVLVQLSMPTAVTAALLATEFGSDVQLVSATILITTLASLISLSLIMTLFVV